MDNNPLKFNNPFRSNEDPLLEVSLQSRLDTADLISKNITETEITAHTYQVKVKALQELLATEEFSPVAKENIKFIIDKVEERLSLEESRKKLILLSKGVKISFEPLGENELWKKGTPLEFVDREEIKTPVVHTMVHASDSARIDALDHKIDAADDLIQSTYEKTEELFPEDFKKIEKRFKDMQKENRTN